MKRLVPYKTIYHTTTYNSWLKIKRDGYLVPQGSDGAGITYDDPTEEEIENYKGKLFFSTTLDEAKNYASYFQEPFVILECSVPESKLLPDKSDCWECETWQDSERETKQVCVKGKMPIQIVKKVYRKMNDI